MVTLNTIDGYPLKTFSDIYGKSTDEKPLVKFDGYMIGNGSIFTEVDTGNIYMYDEENQRWYHQNGDNPPYPPIPEPETPDYLCFTCDGERALISIKVMFEDLSFESTYEFIPNIEVSSDKITWRPFRFSWNNDIIELSDGESVYFRGTNDYFGWDSGEYGYQFYIDDDGSGALVKASGNIMSILDPTCESVTLNEIGGFPCLFYECTALSEAPDLPATTLSGSCYVGMFAGCTSLTSAPDLPATTLEGMCYSGMFDGCTSLVEGPDIAATALEWRSCYEMFRGCSNLEYVGVNFSEWSSNSDTYYWLDGVSETGTFMNNGNAVIPSRDASGVPEGWTIIPEPLEEEPEGPEGPEEEIESDPEGYTYRDGHWYTIGPQGYEIRDDNFNGIDDPVEYGEEIPEEEILEEEPETPRNPEEVLEEETEYEIYYDEAEGVWKDALGNIVDPPEEIVGGN